MSLYPNLHKSADPALRTPRLTVVGAGIGDPELITLRAVRAIGEADVILYDALANDVLLDYARPGAIKLYVGKRRKEKAFEQEEIHELIVNQALTHGHVVRLKGGDPFVFGRGWEEMQYAQAHGLEVAYVPGVSSAVAAAGSAGIAVTLRGVSRSFWTMTATTESGDLNPELAVAAQTDTTVVILMGLHKLSFIVEIWTAAGHPDRAIAIIQDASTPQQQQIIGTIQTIEHLAAKHKNAGPAVIVIGDTVKHVIKALPTQLNHSKLL
jgi:uroporphyrin-III C-methyltransferase